MTVLGALFQFWICLILMSCLQMGESARILGIFPIPGKSHYAVHSALVTELARRGHDLTVITPFPEKSPPPNYKEIVVQINRDDLLNVTSRNSLDMIDLNVFKLQLFVWTMGNIFCNQVFEEDAVQQLINSVDQQFDLILIEGFFIDSFLGFAHKFKAPFIQILTFGGWAFMHDWVGNPTPYAYVPDVNLGYSDKMNFWERLENTIIISFQKVTRRFYFLPEQQKMLEKYFGQYGPLPSIDQLHSSTSLLFLNQHFSISYPRPLLPNVVEVGGMHIKPPKKLPEDLQKYLDDATDGVIYFSLGSHFYSSDMPDSYIKSFLEVFSKLKQKVLWKWEKDSLPGQPKNVKLGKWLPQSDILAHPNVKLFITHGGLLSTQETIYRGVPVVAIPLTADQKLNTVRTVSAGYGVKVDYNNITTESLSWALKEVLENPRYLENAKQISRTYRDQPLTPMEQAVFWTEYVIRHKGAMHMRSAALDLNFFQYFLLDVIAVLVLVIGSILLIPLFLLWALYKKCCAAKQPKNKTVKKKKKN